MEPPDEPPPIPPPEAPLLLPLEPPDEPPMAPLEPPLLPPEVVSRLLPETPAAPLELPERCDLRLVWVDEVLVSELEDEDGPAELPYPPPVVPDEPPVDESVALPLVWAIVLPANDNAPRSSKVIEGFLYSMMALLQTAETEMSGPRIPVNPRM